MQVRVLDLLHQDQVAANWLGTIRYQGVTDSGNAWVTIDIGADFLVTTWSSEADDRFAGTMFKPWSPLFPVVREATIGQPVVFSGRLLSAVVSTDADMVLRPRFITRFSALKITE